MEKRIVGHHDDHPGFHAHIGEGHEGVRRYIQTHVLHRTQTPHPGERRGAGRFHGDLFVDRVLHIDSGLGRELVEAVDDFRGRCPRIGRYKADPAFEGAPHNRFIAQQQLFSITSGLQ